MDDSTDGTFPTRPELGRLVPGFRLVRRLSRTPMSEVYLAEEVDLGDRRVALKVLNPALCDEPSFRERFGREVRMAARLGHPNVIPIHHTGEQGDLLYLVMQYVEGTDLAALLRAEGRLGLARATRIVRQTAAALDAAHRAGLVHRDVKPHNILVDRESEHVYLCDFGIAKRVGDETLSPAGQFIGTLDYASPEQIECRDVDHRADVYSLGCVLYQCLTGARPYAGRDAAAVVGAHLHAEPPRVTALRPDLDPRVDAIVATALAKEPRDRFASCGELADRLAALTGTEAEGAGAQLPGARAPLTGAGAPLTGAEAEPVVPPGPVARLRRWAGRMPGRVPGGERGRVPGGALGGVSGREPGGALGGVSGRGPGGALGGVPGREPGGASGRVPGRWRVPAMLVGAALVIATGVIAYAASGTDVDAAALARVPAPLRAGCARAEAGDGFAGATTLSCRDSSGAEVRVGLFDTTAGVDEAYGAAVREAGVARGGGDCFSAGAGEHRYPGVGPAKGRVLCFARGATRSLVWTDTAARTVARAAVPAPAGAGPPRAWAAWLGEPLFPTEAERTLIDLMEAKGCRRVRPGDLDEFPGAVAGVECDPGKGAGAATVTYYRFAEAATLRRAYSERASAVRAPYGVYCGDDPAGFLGSRRYDIRSAELGSVLCHPETGGGAGGGGGFAVEWSLEPFLVLGRAVGEDSAKLAAWWDANTYPSADKITRAVNAQAKPAFPTAAEQALLERVPAGSRVNCLRPSKRQIATNVHDTSIVGVVCGPTAGAAIVFYYQFPGKASMRKNYEADTASGGGACDTFPKDFLGEGPYTIDGKTAGRLACNGTGDSPYLVWTDERLNIEAFAFHGTDPKTLMAWWRDESGPVPPGD